MANPLSKYFLDLYNKAGTRLASLGGLADNRRVIKSRNEAEEITWSVPLKLFQRYAEDHMIDPTTLLQPRSTEVRVKRGEVELVGGEVFHYNVAANVGEGMIDIRATGYLNLFKDRYTDDPQEYSSVNAPDIAWDLIDQTQSQGDDWDFGITQGTLPTTDTHDITYHHTNIKDGLQALTRRVNGPFDFEFTPDKVFNCYTRIGSRRPEITFRYPGNIHDYEIPNEAEELANYIFVFGSGISAEAAPPVIRQDTVSQANYKVRQKKITPNDVSETETLQDKGDTELDVFSRPFEIPSIIVDGNQKPYVTDYGIGDYVRLIFQGEPFINRVNFYRIEKIDLQIDKNDKERVRLYLSL